MSSVDSPLFRDILLYCGQNKVAEEDVPHRTKLTAAAHAMYLLEKYRIDSEIKV
jgi:hypothetical protein